MEIKHLISFVAVAETGNMTNASNRCNLTQSAISRHIKTLEDELKTTLFERKKNDALITESGKAFLRHARSIIKEVRESINEIESMKGNLCGELHLGVGSFIEPYIRILAHAYMEKYPKVRIFLQLAPAKVLNKMLRDEELDLAFTMNQAYHNEGIDSMPAIPFHLSAIMSRQNRLADKDVVTFKDLMKERVMMPDCGERVFSTFQKYVPFDLSKLDVAAVSSDAGAVLMTIEKMNFITFLPSDYTITSQKLIAKPIEGLDMELMSNAHWLRNVPVKATAKAFLDLIKDYKR